VDYGKSHYNTYKKIGDYAMARFVYYNRNPDGEKESDCVTRAISLATGLSYPQIRKKLYYTAKLLDCEKLCNCCYSFLIERVFNCKPVNCDGMTVNDFANIHPVGVYLVRMRGHISTIWNGDVVDIWDCRDCELTNAWQVKQ
jgi:hypothetical protein